MADHTKNKITKILNSDENSKQNSLINCQNQKLKRMVNNCYIPDLVQAFSYVENCGLNLSVQYRHLANTHYNLTKIKGSLKLNSCGVRKCF